MLVDKTAPSTTSTCDSAWHTAPFSVSLAATDTQSGSKTTFYSIAGSAPETYTGPFDVTAEGTDTVAFWSVDAVGNVEATRSATVKIDASPPVTTSDADSAWHRGPVSVTLSPHDSLSGTSVTFYRVDSGAATTYTAPFSVSAQGSSAVEFWSIDRVGNVESANTAHVRVDDAGPVTATSADTSWHMSPYTVSFVATDAGSGVAATWYRTGPDAGVVTRYEQADPRFVYTGTWTTYSSPNLSGGSYKYAAASGAAATVSFWGTAADWITTKSNTYGKANVSVDGGSAVSVDLYAPSNQFKQCVFSTGALPDGPHTLRITCSGTHDASSTGTYVGIDAADITGLLVDPTASLLSTYTAPFAISAEGTTTVYYRSADALANMEPTQTSYILVDATPPTTTANVDASWHSGRFTVSLTSSDLLSGVATTYYRVSSGGVTTYSAPFDVTSDGSTNVDFWSVDAAGNIESTRSATVKVDSTPPTTTSNVDASWHKGSFTVALTATDTLTGVAATFYTVGAGNATTYTAPFAVSSEGESPVRFWSVDAAGNAEATKTATVRVDQSAPVSGSDIDGLWHRGPFMLSIGATDTLSGVAWIDFRVGGAPTATFTAPVAISAEGATVVSYRACDTAGNQEATNTGTVRVDSTPPTTTSNADDVWHSGHFTVSLEATDAWSGAAATYYSLGGSAPATYAGPFDVTSEGATALTFWSTDAVGNVESTRSATVKIDDTPPLTSSDATSAYVGAAVIDLIANDSLSGVASTFYSTDGSFPTTRYAGPITVTSGGATTLRFYSVDAAGNAEAVHDVTINVDTTPPTTTSTIDGAWHKGSLLVSLAATDTQSGVGVTHYRIAGGADTTYSVPFTVSGDGPVPVSFWSVDRVGNSEPTATTNALLDNSAPVSASNAGAGWHTRPFALTLSAADPYSGAAATRYRLGANSVPVRYEQTDPHAAYTGTWSTYTNVSLSSGSYAYSNQSGASMTLQFSGTGIDWITTKSNSYGKANVSVDGGAATVIDLYAPANQWQQHVWKVSGLADDVHSLRISVAGSKNASSTGTYVGVDALDITGQPIAAGDSLTATYTTPVQISADGTTPVYFYSIDAVGNMESTVTCQARVDGQAPQTTATVTVDGPNRDISLDGIGRAVGHSRHVLPHRVRHRHHVRRAFRRLGRGDQRRLVLVGRHGKQRRVAEVPQSHPRPHATDDDVEH